MLSLGRATLRRLAQLVSVVLVVVFLTVVLLRVVPGDPARAILGPRASQASVEAMQHNLGMDRSLPVQLWQALAQLARGDLGTSLTQSTPVSHLVLDRVGVTLQLSGLALVFGTVLGLLFGLISGMSNRKLTNSASRGVMLLGLALPTFVLGLILLFFVGVRLRLAPAGGWGGSGLSSLEYLWLPALALSGYLVALVARSTARAVQNVRESKFYEAALSRGISGPRLIIRHVLPNSLLPVVVIVGVNAAYLVSGAVTIEAVFGLPGLGTALAQAAQNRDFPVVQGIAVACAVLVVLISWITEIAVAAIDPRVRRAQ